MKRRLSTSRWWARTAEVANEYLSKGSSVLIEGRLKLESWEKDGQKRSKLKVIGEKMQMLGARAGGGGGGGGGRPAQSQSAPQESYDQGAQYSEPAPAAQSSSAAQSAPDDEIPF